MPKPQPGGSGLSNTVAYEGFFNVLLRDLGITPSPGALLGLADVVHEEGKNQYYNPFNIEWHPGNDPRYKGTKNFNSVGVQEYASAQAGELATVAFLQDNPRWSALIDALKSGSKANVDRAFTDIYTWATFKPGTTSQDNAILGSALNTGKPLHGQGSTYRPTLPQVPGVVAVTSMLDIAKAIWKDATSVDFWIRVGFIILGFVILLIAIDKMSDGGVSGETGGSPSGTVDVIVTNTGTATKKAATATKSSVKGGVDTVKRNQYEGKHKTTKPKETPKPHKSVAKTVAKAAK